jgi:hypothetical protein
LQIIREKIPRRRGLRIKTGGTLFSNPAYGFFF